MPNRRDFFRTVAGATAGAFALGSGWTGAAGLMAQSPAGGRREISIGGRRVRVIDVHAHCVVPLQDIVKGTPFEKNGGGGGNQIIGPMRIAQMDKAGIDMQALSINGFWWWNTDRDLATRIVRAQNEGLAKIVSTYPDRFVALASIALQYPDLAAQQLEDAVKRLGMRGTTIGGHNNEDLSLPKYDPFWAKAAELGAPVFMHPGGADSIIKEGAWRGRGDLGNIIGNPLETTYFLSRMIFDGTLDRHPNLRIVGAHAGGYLPSYMARTDVACKVRNNANCANKKDPREYFKREILVDTMVFTDEGLRHLVNEVGVGQLVYGTDIPFNWPANVDLILNASYLSNADKEAILSGNLMKLLRITS
jgi:aminocarboxymuconate-semialdehyde decarboxylase